MRKDAKDTKSAKNEETASAFPISAFGFVSDFGFRVSDFLRDPGGLVSERVADLPQQLFARKDRSVGAGQAVGPVFSLEGNLIDRLAHADAAALAGAHAAGHRPLD